ncbi:MAG TPA: hypothetical protein VFG42_25345 [Baekduia sp.]|uniref:hypothetical protein n=1 Tax=Baekduia sp. TaxID=2600305 RepID=UPI002D7A0352|nr:hypothetical protein [Baekduia sp.]HET6510142.1 hypothetical protein [Baekduia sp.]
MNPRIRKLAVLVGTTTLFGGAVAGCGSGSSSGSTSSNGASASTGQQSGAPDGQSGGGPGGMMSSATLETLATKLGVSTTALQNAMRSSRPSGARPDAASSSAPPSSSSSSSDPRTRMAAAIAKALNLSESKVTAALKDAMPSAPSPPGPATTRSS